MLHSKISDNISTNAIHNERFATNILTIWRMENSLGSTESNDYVLALPHDEKRVRPLHRGNGGFGIASKDAEGNWVNAVGHSGLDEGACLAVKNIGEPRAGKPHARFDEGGLVMRPALYSTYWLREKDS
jgi:hypothetical protein